jgi:ribosomal protein S6--L-glutamate ligase
VIDITSHRPAIVYGGSKLEGVDAVIPRIGASHTFYGTAVVRQFEMMGVYPTNESQAISRSRDKLRSLQLLAAEGVGLPVTSFAHSTKDIDGLISLVGGRPVVVKLLEGTQGMGVVLAETKKAAESVIGAFRQLDANILVQEFIKEAGGSDIRAFVVGNRVVAAMERTAAPGRLPLERPPGRGGPADPADPRGARHGEARGEDPRPVVAGVDLMRSNHGPVVLEVNSSPGSRASRRRPGVDVAGKVIEFIEPTPSQGHQPGTQARPEPGTDGRDPGQRAGVRQRSARRRSAPSTLRAAISTGSQTGENGGA